MKIRGKRIEDVLKFTTVPHDGKKEVVPKTNSVEADFIMAELKKLVTEGRQCSVGVITPHTNQQKLIYQQALQMPEGNDLFDRYRLKVMTFDTCQGEERDVIYYSMVATDQDDRLGYVFPKDLDNVDFESDGRIRVQRLNVGFSRTKECMHFVLSRDLSQYTGAIGEALRHYQDVQVKAKKEVLPTEVDEASPMEANVLNWLYQTRFWKEKQDSVEVIPQFPIGEYLQQLDRTYSHPKYKVDFLLLYDDGSYEHKIIIEYDGFKEHFTNLDAVNEFNYQYYYRDDDVYREKVLEGYGYRFLRINRFNLGENPIATLDERIEKLVERRQVDNAFLSRIHSMISQLENGQMKECPKCKKVLPKQKFYDSTLSTNYGRICTDCKGSHKVSRKAKRERVHEAAPTSCPKCGSRMVVRNGRYGYFYGCKRYPYCKGTRNIA
jgi:ssDNA-binding Zn-finger/Zn-ribbon topoisomerase 1